MVLSAKVNKPVKNNNVVNIVPAKKKNTKKKKLKFKLNGPVAIFLILLGFLLYSFSGQVIEMYKVRAEINKIRSQMNDLQAKNAELRKQVEQLSSNAYIEREAREKLGLVKPGEKIILEAKTGSGGLEPNNVKKRENADVH